MEVPIFLTAEEVAKLLRKKKTWVYEKARNSEIPHIRTGKYLTFDRDEVLAWFQSFHRGPESESTPVLRVAENRDRYLT